MLIALDYDETYTLDPEFWNDFIRMIRERGHRVVCATMRYDTPFESKAVRDTIGKTCEVIFTGRKAKKEFLENINIHPDVWIDDNPLWLYQNG